MKILKIVKVEITEVDKSHENCYYDRKKNSLLHQISPMDKGLSNLTIPLNYQKNKPFFLDLYNLITYVDN